MILKEKTYYMWKVIQLGYKNQNDVWEYYRDFTVFYTNWLPGLLFIIIL
jgi:hypothetical protein